MRKFRAVIMAVAAAMMVTSCSSILKNGELESQKESMTEEAEAQEPETGMIRIESETDAATEAVSEQETEFLAEPETVSATNTKETETAAKAYSVTALQKTMYVTQPVHVRASYTTQSEVLTSLGTGHKVTVTGISENGWMRIKYNGNEAYIYKKYLSEKKTSAKSSAGSAVKEKETAGVPANDPSGSTEIPIVEPSPITPSVGSQGSLPSVGPGASTSPVTGTVSSVGPAGTVE